MRSFRTYLALVLALVCLSSCWKKDKLIPRATMVDIYTDMFISDYWLREHYDQSKIADTTRFYEPIFNRYGFTTLDFINSADYYLKDPRRFARMLQKSVAKLDAEARRLEKLSSDISTQEAEIEAYMSSARIPRVFYDSLFFAVAGRDGVVIEQEECGAYMPVIKDPDADKCDTLMTASSDSTAFLLPDDELELEFEESEARAERPLRGPKHRKDINNSDELKLPELEDKLEF